MTNPIFQLNFKNVRSNFKPISQFWKWWWLIEEEGKIQIIICWQNGVGNFFVFVFKLKNFFSFKICKSFAFQQFKKPIDTVEKGERLTSTIENKSAEYDGKCILKNLFMSRERGKLFHLFPHLLSYKYVCSYTFLNEYPILLCFCFKSTYVNPSNIFLKAFISSVIQTFNIFVHKNPFQFFIFICFLFKRNKVLQVLCIFIHFISNFLIK